MTRQSQNLGLRASQCCRAHMAYRTQTGEVAGRTRQGSGSPGTKFLMIIWDVATVSGLRARPGNDAQQRKRLFAGLEMCPHGPSRLLGIALAERGQYLGMVFVRLVLDARQLLRFGAVQTVPDPGAVETAIPLGSVQPAEYSEFRGAGLDARYQHRRARDEHLHRAAADAVGPEADVLTT